MKQKKIIVVLGMHRSGTSAVTRGLKGIGVELGNNLMPPAANVNERGFWEDLDIHALNEDILAALGKSWHSVCSIRAAELMNPKLDSLRLRAVELIENKIKDTCIFGFKDPRVCRLLPFWQQVFKCFEVEDKYVIAIRNPLSVAKSLGNWWGFCPELSYLLWLEHIIPAIRFTVDKPRVVIEYDNLMKEPRRQMERIAGALGINIEDSHKLDLEDFAEEFLAEELRHSAYNFGALALDSRIPKVALDAYGSLLKLANDRALADQEKFEKGWRRINEVFESLVPFCDFLDRKLIEIATATRLVADRDSQVAVLRGDVDALHHEVSQRDSQIASLSQATAERDSQLAVLRGEVEGLRQEVAHRDSQIAELRNKVSAFQLEVAHRTGQIDALNQLVSERDRRVELLIQGQHAIEAQSQHLHLRLGGANAEVERLRATLIEVWGSAAWKITFPMRWTLTRLRSIGVRTDQQVIRPLLRLPKRLVNKSLDSWRRLGNRWRVNYAKTNNYYRVHGLWQTVRKVIWTLVKKSHYDVQTNLTKITSEESGLRTNAKSMSRISFVVNSHDLFTHRYRVYNLCEEFEDMGIECRVMHDSELVGWEPSSTTDLIVLCRIASAPYVEEAVKRCRRAGIPVVFDIDDLIFDPGKGSFIRALKCKTDEERLQFIDNMVRFRSSLLRADFVTCSTQFLATEIKRLGKTVWVIPNSINRAQRELADKLNRSKIFTDKALINIGYFSGTKSHQVDFQEVSSAILLLLEKFPHLRFHAVGEFDLPPSFGRFDDRIVCRPLMDYLPMLEYLSQMDINLSPLEMENPFTAGKSELKIFEAALVLVPTVASAVDSYARIIEDGITGFLARDQAEWVSKLSRLIEDPALRRDIASRALNEIVPAFDNRKIAQEAVNIYRDILARYTPSLRASDLPVYRRERALLPKRLKEVPGIGECRIAIIKESGFDANPILEAWADKWRAEGASVDFYQTPASCLPVNYDLLIIDAVSMKSEMKSLIQRAQDSWVRVAYFSSTRAFPGGLMPDWRWCAKKPSQGKNQDVRNNRYEALWACDCVLTDSRTLFEESKHIGKQSYLLPPADPCSSDFPVAEIVDSILTDHKRRHLPMISVVGVLYRKADQIENVLKSFFRQTYPGDFEIILVDDRSPDDSVDRAKAYFSERSAQFHNLRLPEIKFITSDINRGNCISRNAGIQEARGDIVIVIDMDCMVNKDFLWRHAEAHSFEDCDVVIGPMNIETNGEPPLRVLEAYEIDPQRVLRDHAPQDWINRRSFLNCVTRNFSVKRALLTNDLFDPEFSYSEDPKTGFGWEDVEMGYRLYKAGARIKFVQEAFSIHISHPSNSDEKTKPARSLLNFRKLFDVHPELLFVARRWVLDTYQKITGWCDQRTLPHKEDRRSLDQRFERFLPPPFYIRSKRKLQILTYRWHPGHQYELYKLPYEFTLISDLGTSITRAWELSQRPLPENVEFRSIHDIRVADYDLAILHFDENVLSPLRTRGATDERWGDTFKWFRENISLPMVAICHGTPQFYGQYDIDYRKPDLLKVIEEERVKLVDFLGDVLVVNNSFQAEREWRFKKSKVIWHGFDPTEFPPSTYERGILSPSGDGMLQRPHYRGYFLHEQVFKDFPMEHRPEKLYVREPPWLYVGNQYAEAKFRNYVDQVRRYSIYFNPTVRSPMPRARGEAMLCGLVNVSCQNHDVELFIKNGINGFYSTDPGELREYLLYLLKNPEVMKSVGMAGRLLAMDLFNHDRYLMEWESVISGLIG